MSGHGLSLRSGMAQVGKWVQATADPGPRSRLAPLAAASTARRHVRGDMSRDQNGSPGWGIYFKILIARAITSAAMTSDTAASVIISSLAHRLIAETSVGLNAIAVQNDSDR